jgi:hypothetical protein
VKETRILLHPSFELQDGSSNFLFIASVSSLGTTISAKKAISFDFDPIVQKPKKMKKFKYEFNKVFQDIWIAKLPWAEVVMGPNGKLSMVKCKV